MIRIHAPARELLSTNMNDDFWLSSFKQKLLKLAKLNKRLISQPRKPGIQLIKATLSFGFFLLQL